jgi:L-threonylcarbamoyladenylate synthase
MPSQVSEAVAILRRGGLVAIPTETVYGLAADASNELAVRRIFAVKGRPASHPLIVHLGSADWLNEWAREVPAQARQLASAFWPGPLTLVLKRTERASDAVTGGQDTVALRVPAHPLAEQLLHELGGGLAAPSANRFGRLSPTTAAHVRSDLGDDVELILDGGPCAVGVESTIVDLSSGEPAILRPGGVSAEALGKVLGRSVPLRNSSEVRVPGALASHYAPRAGVLLVNPGEAKARVEALRAEGKRVAVFESAPDVVTAARELYARLREIDAQGYEVIVAVLPPATDLGLAVRDRLTRAAGPRM